MQRIPGKLEKVRAEVGKIGKIWSHLEGRPCQACGWLRYYLEFRVKARNGESGLVAVCSRCHRQRVLDGTV
jgi:hypothetical protein